MTILIACHQSAERFKWFYTQLVCRKERKALPRLVNLTLRGMDAIHPDSAVRLLAPLLWQLYWNQLY